MPCSSSSHPFNCSHRFFFLVQFRTAWTVDNKGNYRSHIPSPTGIAADPPLTSHGIAQAEELAAHLATLTPAVEAVYSSPYYRCLQTIDPFVRLQSAAASTGTLAPRAADTVRIRGEHGVCEWFGAAPFEHPQPADAAELRGLFAAYDADFVSPVKPRVHGETYAQLVARVRAAMQALIRRCDDEGRRSVVICSHAAVIIVLGRVLTGQHPDEMDTEDFKAFTCGLSVYARGGGAEGNNTDGKSDNGESGSTFVLGATCFCSFSPFLRWRTSRVSETAERLREKVGKENHADH